MSSSKPISTPTLNWKEISLLTASFRDEVQGLFVDRIIVPERPRFAGGYLKGEWAIRLTGRRNEGIFLFSIRPRHPYLFFRAGKGPKASPQGTRSPFDLELSKRLKGQRLLELETLHRERTVILWFTDPEARHDQDRLGLVLNQIPAAPEALLVRKSASDTGKNWLILTRSRITKHNEGKETHYSPPDGSQAPEAPAVRGELVASSETFARAIEAGLDGEAFELRLRAAQRELRSIAKQAEERSRQTRTTLEEAKRDQDWQRYGDLLKNSLHQASEILTSADGKTNYREVYDYATEGNVRVPADPKLAPSAQVEKFYQLARRKARRISEAESRIANLEEARARILSKLEREPEAGDWKALENLERSANTSPSSAKSPAEGKAGKKGAWLGKTFISKDEMTILCGRSKDENLELTFKHARGNDVWMHVRGRPGAHTVIPLQAGKSAPLETLLDAANLTIYYSGGEKWGKTEVDYTFKKYVKRIKDSTEASYTNNKTLIIEPDPQRIKRLLDRAAE